MSETLPLFNWLTDRAAGLLLHPTSLPGRHGVGSLGEEAFELLDFLAQADISYWQVLPLNPTGFGDSPYSSFSAFAGNPYLIDVHSLMEFGLLEPRDIEPLEQLPHHRVDFGALYQIKWPVLRLAHRRFRERKQAYLPNYGLYEAFKEEHAYWLEPFSHFMALKGHYNGKPWYQWDKKHRTWKLAKKETLPAEALEQAEAHRFFQYLFFGQWKLVRARATELGISIIGDVPIFVSADSADVWAEPEVFQLNKHLEMDAVAGVPPDYFSPEGQLWGNPLFNWEQLKKTGYDWWLRRMEINLNLVDVVRLDHFRGFCAYWRIPASSKTAIEGTWESGPGLDFFKAVKRRFPDARIIAEDLGEIDDSVRDLLRDSGLPGMGVLHFGFSLQPNNLNLPQNMSPNQVVYTGTHDNNTTRGWYDCLSPQIQDQVRRFVRGSGEDISWDLIRECYRAVPKLAIIPAQDLIGLGADARMNVPGSSQGNWQWRLTGEQFSWMRNSAAYLKELAWLYSRYAEEPEE